MSPPRDRSKSENSANLENPPNGRRTTSPGEESAAKKLKKDEVNINR